MERLVASSEGNLIVLILIGMVLSAVVALFLQIADGCSHFRWFALKELVPTFSP